ncbi:transposable element Tcb1 transposase [Trichonephila clavipes]|nr:transposable element Tcb1 transposase [Trichonephila clavipes]
MIEAGWSARRVARQVDSSDLTVRRYWIQLTEDTSFTRQPGAQDALDRPVIEKTFTSYDTDKFRFNLSRDDNPVRVWKPRDEWFNPAFDLQRHSTLTTVTCGRAPRSSFSTRQCSATHRKDVARLPSPHYELFLAFLIPRFVTNRAYLGSFGTASWTAHEFGRTRIAFIATVERDVSGHHSELLCLNAFSYRNVHSR